MLGGVRPRPPASSDFQSDAMSCSERTDMSEVELQQSGLYVFDGPERAPGEQTQLRR